ncbi:unnamed protein product [Hydatigera taeniaeformis]|uniref:Secreted protein n=1 Tax=Hydatigena taeniaeformis TaxID=6205 RepID=A0A0R3X3R1_HYDTA|nr:unnamed protein product [Hydatigera taeniaeformis]
MMVIFFGVPAFASPSLLTIISLRTQNCHRSLLPSLGVACQDVFPSHSSPSSLGSSSSLLEDEGKMSRKTIIEQESSHLPFVT